MNLRAYQEAVRTLSFALAADTTQLPGFGLYREMIRARFFAMAEAAFRRAWALAPDACAASFARYLAARPPASPILREVIAGFAPFALQDRALSSAAPAAFADVVRFEAAKWQVASSDARLADASELRELDFDGVLVCNPTLVTLALRYDASEPGLTDDPHTLLVYRRDGDDDVHWYRAPEPLRALLAAGEQTIAACVRARFADDTLQDGQAYLEELASALAVAVERGVLLGVRDPRGA